MLCIRHNNLYNYARMLLWQLCEVPILWWEIKVSTITLQDSIFATREEAN